MLIYNRNFVLIKGWEKVKKFFLIYSYHCTRGYIYIYMHTHTHTHSGV